MNLFEKVTSLLPFGKPQVQAEYFFGLNIGPENLKVCLWALEGDKLKILNTVSGKYSSSDEIVEVSDKLLDQALGDLPFEPEKILFGVPDSWLIDDNLKDQYLQLLRNIVKTLDLKPMAYVSSSHAIAHFLEKTESAPTTAVLLGVGETYAAVTVVRGGKIDGTKVAKRADNLGEDAEKLLANFTEIEVLPSRMLLYSFGDSDLTKQKSTLLSYSWMSHLSFLHLPKIDILEKDIEINSVALAGAVELNPDVKYQRSETPLSKSASTLAVIPEEEVIPIHDEPKETASAEASEPRENLGFVAGDITEQATEGEKEGVVNDEEPVEESSNLKTPSENELQDEDQEEEYQERAVAPNPPLGEVAQWETPPKGKWGIGILRGYLKFIIPVLVLLILAASYLFLVKATVTIFVEPKVLEKDAQVTADPKAKSVDETNKIIPGQIVETQVSGSDKASATGTKQVGESAKGSVVLYNATSGPVSLASGTSMVTDGGIKFTLDSSLQIASKSASAADPPTQSKAIGATADKIGGDGNIPSDTELKVGNYSKSEVVAKTQGNFSGGSSKDVTVVSDEDQKKLLASLASSLRKQAQDKLQGKLAGKKILEEALTEEIVKKAYSKNINDQAPEFSLNLIVNYKGTAYLDSDLKSIVSKLVETNVPGDFELNLAETETQADVSKVDKDGKLIFLARFKAKLTPKLNVEEIRSKIKGKTPQQVADILKSYDNVLGSEIKLSPPIPAKIARLPLLDKNIKIEVSLK